jgi:hypothetical protein
LGESETIVVEADKYTIYKDSGPCYNKILALNEGVAPKLGILARILYYWKAQIKAGKKSSYPISSRINWG